MHMKAGIKFILQNNMPANKIYFFHDDGESSSKMGKISRRPTSITNDSNNLEAAENDPKFPKGPTNSSPGPMLLIHEATAVKFVTRSYSSNIVISKTAAENTTTYIMKNDDVLLKTSDSTGLDSKFTDIIDLGLSRYFISL